MRSLFRVIVLLACGIAAYDQGHAQVTSNQGSNQTVNASAQATGKANSALSPGQAQSGQSGAAKPPLRSTQTPGQITTPNANSSADEFHGYRAVVVCVSEWGPNSGFKALPNALTDCKNLQSAFSLMHYTVTVLANERATKASVLKAIGEVSNLETLVVAFSSHGASVRDRNLIVLAKTTIHDLEREGLFLDEVDNAIRNVSPRRALVLADVCRGTLSLDRGTVLSKGGDGEVLDYFVQGPTARGSSNIGHVYATEHRALAFEDSFGGIFTQAIARNIAAGARDIKLKSLVAAVGNDVARWRGPDRQTQRIHDATVGGDFILGRRFDDPALVELNPQCVETVPGICNREIWRGFPVESAYCIDRVSPTILMIYDQHCSKQLSYMKAVEKSENQFQGRFKLEVGEIVAAKLAFDGNMGATLTYQRADSPTEADNSSQSGTVAGLGKARKKTVAELPVAQPAPSTVTFAQSEEIQLLPVKLMPEGARRLNESRKDK